MQLSGLGRAAVITALAAAAVGAGIGPAVATSTASPAITITVTSKIPKITGDVVTEYKDGEYDKVTVNGTVSATASGEVAELYAQQFPYKSAAKPVPGQRKSLGNAANAVSYSFTAVPALATRYSVRLLASSSATSALANSATKTVYVAADQRAYSATACTTTVCNETIQAYTILPASAYKAESAKRWYFYLGVSLSKTKAAPPKWLYLDTAAKISKVKRISATEFERTISFSFRIDKEKFSRSSDFCSKNTESQDGINLPGTHSCGAKKVENGIAYLG